MNNREKTLLLICSAFLLFLPAVVLLIQFSSSGQSPDCIELCEGRRYTDKRLHYGHRRIDIFINKQGAIKLSTIDNRTFQHIAQRYVIESGADGYLLDISNALINPPNRPLYVHQDGRIHLPEENVTITQLREQINCAVSKWGVDGPVAVFADKNTPNSKITPVLKELVKAGKHHVFFVNLIDKSYPLFRQVRLISAAFKQPMSRERNLKNSASALAD